MTVRIAFFGDVHGCVRHALAAAAAVASGPAGLDAVIQVGDLGAYQSPARLRPNERRFIEENPAQGDIFEVLDPDDELRRQLAAIKERLPEPPMLFVSGNHDDDAWLASLHRATNRSVVAIDPVGVIHHAASGELVTLASGCRVAFLGGCDAPGLPFDIPDDALDRLRPLPPESVDVLVTHDGPYGIATNWQGRTQGSRRITELIDQLQPRFHISGHYHHADGPRSYGITRSYMLAQLVPPKTDRWDRNAPNPTQRIGAGGIGVLDLDSDRFDFLDEPWMAAISGDTVDLRAHFE